MMKHISKKVLLFGALSMLASGVPLQAMEGTPEDVQQEVAQKQGFFARWTEKAKQARLKTLMKELDQNWKPFMRCVKGKEGCPRKLVWTIRGILASIIAIVGIAGTAAITAKYGPTKGWPERAKEAYQAGVLKEAIVEEPGWLMKGEEEDLTFDVPLTEPEEEKEPTAREKIAKEIEEIQQTDTALKIEIKNLRDQGAYSDKDILEILMDQYNTTKERAQRLLKATK